MSQTRGALAAVVVAGGLAVFPANSAAQEPGVHFDPGSPSGKEYQIPLNDARGVGSGGTQGRGSQGGARGRGGGSAGGASASGGRSNGAGAVSGASGDASGGSGGTSAGSGGSSGATNVGLFG